MQVWVIRSFLRWSQSCGFIKKILIGLSLCSDKSFTRIDLVSIFNIFPHRHVRIYPTFIVIIADCFNLLFYSFINVSHQVGWRLFKVCVMSSSSPHHLLSLWLCLFDSYIQFHIYKIHFYVHEICFCSWILRVLGVGRLLPNRDSSLCFNISPRCVFLPSLILCSGETPKLRF